MRRIKKLLERLRLPLLIQALASVVSPVEPTLDAAELSRVGLCAACEHARAIVSAKGSKFWLCERASSDPMRFRKYPALPVLRCSGFERHLA
jgi:hypothetical protein